MNAASGALRVGLAGLGTVGTGVGQLLERNRALLAQRCGRDVVVTAVSARDKSKPRGFDLGGVAWHDDPVDLARDPNVDLVAELIGGEDVADAVCRAALAGGKSLVTANKALLASSGIDLAQLAERHALPIGCEAAIAGGIPIVKTLKEGLAANAVGRVYGILNGTCNYILTQMTETGREFADVLEEAQALGYAEADPSFDVDGVDAAHKLAILTSLAFGCTTNFDAIHVEGIRHVVATDIAFAKEFGYRIKLLAVAALSEKGVEQRVHPCMVSLENPIAHVDGVFNAVVVEGNFVDRVVLEGRGAGAGPTASAVVADIADIACNRAGPCFGVPVGELCDLSNVNFAEMVCRYYMRLMVYDRPGVIADIAAVLRDEQISIESMLQRGRSEQNAVPLVMISHDVNEAAVNRAIARIAELDTVLETPRFIRIQNF